MNIRMIFPLLLFCMPALAMEKSAEQLTYEAEHPFLARLLEEEAKEADCPAAPESPLTTQEEQIAYLLQINPSCGARHTANRLIHEGITEPAVVRRAMSMLTPEQEALATLLEKACKELERRVEQERFMLETVTPDELTASKKREQQVINYFLSLTTFR